MTFKELIAELSLLDPKWHDLPVTYPDEKFDSGWCVVEAVHLVRDNNIEPPSRIELV